MANRSPDRRAPRVFFHLAKAYNKQTKLYFYIQYNTGFHLQSVSFAYLLT